MDKIIIPNEVITNKIYFIRNTKVMLDRDLAELYSVESFRLREQVKRNIDKFPEHFMFRLTEIEVGLMVSQNAIPSKQALGFASLGIYGTRNITIIQCCKKRKSYSNEHQNNRDLC